MYLVVGRIDDAVVADGWRHFRVAGLRKTVGWTRRRSADGTAADGPVFDALKEAMNRVNNGMKE